MRQVDQVHDAEDERQPGRQQEQEQPKLQTVQALFDQQQHGAGPGLDFADPRQKPLPWDSRDGIPLPVAPKARLRHDVGRR